MRRFAVNYSLLIAVLALVCLLPACKKRTVVTPGPAAASPDQTSPSVTPGPAPTIQLSASSTSIQRGEQTTLTWSSTNASSIVIDNGVGNVAESGSLVVSPAESITYTATARGNGEARASTRVTVLPATAATADIDQSDIQALRRLIEQGVVRPIFFAYDKAELSSESRQILEQNAIHFRRHPNATVIVEGHCDERGTEEYNLALGDRRAQAARDYLAQLGVDPARLETISFGEERPFVLGDNESAWAQNRRAHFTVRDY